MASGLAGAYMSLVYTPMWAENMTAGRGWIALALVVFSTWRPARLLLGAYLFGGISILQLYVQGTQLPIPSQFLSMLPYLDDHPGAGPDLAGPDPDPPERPGLPRPALPRRRLRQIAISRRGS